jgi:hypothetical protein
MLVRHLPFIVHRTLTWAGCGALVALAMTATPEPAEARKPRKRGRVGVARAMLLAEAQRARPAGPRRRPLRDYACAGRNLRSL